MLEEESFGPLQRTQILALTKSSAESYRRGWRTQEQRITVLQPSIDPTRQRPELRSAQHRAAVRAKLGLAEGSRRPGCGSVRRPRSKVSIAPSRRFNRRRTRRRCWWPASTPDSKDAIQAGRMLGRKPWQRALPRFPRRHPGADGGGGRAGSSIAPRRDRPGHPGGDRERPAGGRHRPLRICRACREVGRRHRAARAVLAGRARCRARAPARSGAAADHVACRHPLWTRDRAGVRPRSGGRCHRRPIRGRADHAGGGSARAWPAGTVARYVPISIIVTTYNRPDALEAVLRGLARQSDKDFEVIVADDGSTPDTAAC